MRALSVVLAFVAVVLIVSPAYGSEEIIENFDGSSLVAAWWGADSVPPFVYTLGFANTQHVHSGEFSLKIDFEKRNDSESPFSFLSASGQFNFSNFDYLSFWVYNTGTPLHVKVRLEDDAGNPWETDWADIWPAMKTPGADWENLVVDLTRGFSATSVNWKAIRNIMFMVSPGDVTNRGSFWLDDIALTRAPNGAPLEPFESDFYGWSGGGVFTNMGLSVQHFQNSGSPTDLGQQSLRITWTNKSANYDNFTYTPQHDTNAPLHRVGRYTNFTTYGNNTFDVWVKSTTDNNFPILLKFTGSAGTSDVNTVNYTGAGTWQKLSWNFSAQAAIASKLETVWLFPYPNMADNGGTMYIDNIALSGGTGTVLPLAPTSFWSNAGTPDEDGQFTIQWTKVAGATNYVFDWDTSVNFTNYTRISTTGTSMNISMDPAASGGTYYYRVASMVSNVAGTFTAPLRVRVHQFPEAARARDVIADFDSPGQVLAWWGSDPDDPWVYQQNFKSTEHVLSGQHSMHVVYNKANEQTPSGATNAYSFFSASGHYNFLNFDYLSFWVYNNGSPLRIKVRLEQLGNFEKAWETDWAAIFPRMETGAADWENIAIDLSRAFYAHSVGDIDLTQVGQIMFMIEPGSETATGEFWMDDIALHRSVNSAPLDVFESDFYGWASGAPFSITNTTEEFFNDGSVFGLGQSSLIIEWGPKEKNFSNITYEPAHDTNSAPPGRIGNYTNFALYDNNTIEMRIKSPTDASIPILLKFDEADVGVQTYTGAGEWQNVRWEMDAVPGRENVTKLYIIPYPNMADDGGVMYLDDLNLVGGSIPEVPYAPLNLASTAAEPDDDGMYEVTWSAVPGAVMYELQEDTDPNFGSPVSLFTNTPFFAFAKNPLVEKGTFFYRVRSSTAAGYGSFTASIKAQVVPPPVEQVEVLADFEFGGAISAWWGSDPADPWVYQQDFRNQEHVFSGDYAMKVVYDKANEVRTNELGEVFTNAYSFMSASGLFNLHSFDYLSFWVYNTGTPLRIKVRFEQFGDYNKAWETDWADIFPRTVTTNADWENICIDLTRSFFGHANGEIDMTQIGQIMFMVEPGSETASGEFWVDDIVLRRAPNSAPLEPFESDLYGWAGGGAFTNLSLTNEVFHNDGLPFGLGQSSLKVTWDAKAQGYDNFTYEPGHDGDNAPAGRIGNYQDFTLYDNHLLELWVSSPTETNMPILLKFDDADVGVLSYRGTGEWQRLVWDYSNVSGATNVAQVFVIPYPNMADDGGVMYLDDMNLFGGRAAPIPIAPGRFRTTAKNPDGDGHYHFRWDDVGADEYEVEESADQNFGSVTVLRTNGTRVAVTKDPIAEAGTYYYRARSVVGTNKSSYAAIIPVTVEYQPAAQLAYENLETFDGGINEQEQVSFWWANDPVPPFAYTLDFGSTQHVHSGVVALKVDYDKNNDVNVFSFMSAAGLFNFRNHDYLSFWVYNDGSPLKFLIRLEDNAGGFFESGWAGIMPETRTPEADWENLAFDLSRTYGADSIDLTAVSQIIFMVAPGDGTNSGTFWMDDVQLQRAVNSAPLDAFESDAFGWYAADIYGKEIIPVTRPANGNRLNIGQHSLRLVWTNKLKDYSGIQYLPVHDEETAPVGRIGNYPDFAMDGNYLLELWVMSPTEFRIPILLKFDDADVGVQTYTGEGEWEKLVWDFSEIQGATNVSVVHVLPFPNQADEGGEIYFDDLNLAGGTPWQAPEPPTGLAASYPTAEGQFTIAWLAASNVTGYQVLEADNGDFRYPTAFYTTNLLMQFSHHPTTEGGTWFYRVRSYEVVNGVTNVGAYTLAVSVYVPSLSSQQGWIEERSYDTLCAEMDNINVPLWHTNTSAFRVTVTHPAYYPSSINERGHDFDDCDFADRTIWKIGNLDGSSAEFKQSGYGEGDVHYTLDHPPAGIDEPWSEFPAELDTSVMSNQYIVFTAFEPEDVNLVHLIGSRLMVAMREVTGTLDLRVSIGNGTDWLVLTNQVEWRDGRWQPTSNHVFNAQNLVRHWQTPDFFWSEETDMSTIRLEVVPSEQGGETTPGAHADYDALQLTKRDEAGEMAPKELIDVPWWHVGPSFATLYEDGNVIVEAIHIDFWWRAPAAMTVITPQGSATDVHYFRIVKRVPDTNTMEYSQVFVMYEDGNVRLLPHPPKGVDWTPFGASVIVGPTVESDRPFAAIDTVTVNPKDLSMDIVYKNGGSCRMDLWVDREQNVVDVTDIRYDTTTNSFTRFRSMWVFDGKADIDRVETADGVFPIQRHWNELHGTWWKFFKEVTTYHNTYCPEFAFEITDPIKAFLVRQAETLDEGIGYTKVIRTGGRGNEAISFGLDGGEATFHVYLDRGRPDTHMIIRYADDDGGNNGDYPGNLVQVYIDDELIGQAYGMNTGGWNDFDMLPNIPLGDLLPGWHTIRIVVGPGTFGMDMDEFKLVSHPKKYWVRESILVRQGEDYDSASNIVDAVRSGAVGGQSIHMEQTNSTAYYQVTLSAPATQVYMRVRYSDDVGPTMLKIYMDETLKARFPTLSTHSWDSFTNSQEIYIGNLTAGSHTFAFRCSEETWGLDLDEFELYTKRQQNRAPQFFMEPQYDVPIESITDIRILAFDPDGDDITISAVTIPPSSGFNGRYLTVTTTVADAGTSNMAAFTCDDGQGTTNSTASGSTWIIVPTDWDGDGLPDVWEWMNFQALEYGADDDPDGDGAPNWFEYQASTSPTNSESALMTTAASPKPAEGDAYLVTVKTEPGRKYTLWITDGMLGPTTTWRTFNDTSNGVGTWVETNVVSAKYTFVDDFSAGTSGGKPQDGIRYYRVKAGTP